MLDYPALAAVAAVVREGSFDRAALALGITPSAVSQRVRGLEERLGAVLVIRGQPCTATDLGKRLAAHLDQVSLLEADLAPLLGKDALPGGSAMIPVAVNSDSLATWFPAAAAHFLTDSGLSLDVTLDDEAHTVARLRSGEVLAAVTADPEPAPGCRNTALGALRYRACASPAFIAKHFANGVTADSLAHAPCLRFDPRDGLQARWTLKAVGDEVRGPIVQVPSTHTFVDLALAGAAWGMQPEILIRDHLASGRLVDLGPEVIVDVGLWWNVVRLHAGALHRLSDSVVAVARERLIAR